MGSTLQTLEKAAGAQTAPKRVLVVDDAIDYAESLAELLHMSGHFVETAHDGVEAVRRAKWFRPDVILLDVGLPGMDGYDACRTIRNESWGREIRIFAVTGWTRKQDQRASEEAGFDGHLSKPVGYGRLTALLDGEQRAS